MPLNFVDRLGLQYSGGGGGGGDPPGPGTYDDGCNGCETNPGGNPGSPGGGAGGGPGAPGGDPVAIGSLPAAGQISPGSVPGITIGNLSQVTSGFSATLGNVNLGYTFGKGWSGSVLVGVAIGIGFEFGISDPYAGMPIGGIDIGFGHNLGITVGLSRSYLTGGTVVSSVTLDTGASAGLPVGYEIPVF